jgi:hypothetical protein
MEFVISVTLLCVCGHSSTNKSILLFLLFPPYVTAKPSRGKLAVGVVLLVCAKEFTACRTWVYSLLLLHFVCLTGFFFYRYLCIFKKITRERNVNYAYTWIIGRFCRQKWIYLMFVVPYILVTYMFYSSPTRCTIFFISFLTALALHVSGAICTHHQEHNCSVQP